MTTRGKTPPVENSNPDKRVPYEPPRSKRASVVRYLAILFIAAFLLLLMAYFMQTRTAAQTAILPQPEQSAAVCFRSDGSDCYPRFHVKQIEKGPLDL